MSEMHCYSCGDTFPSTPPTGGASGYALYHGERFCYPCADDRERGFFHTASKFTGYLSSDGTKFTTWTGGELARVAGLTESRRAGFGRGLAYVTAIAPDGSSWHGKGAGRGMVLRMHRSRV